MNFIIFVNAFQDTDLVEVEACTIVAGDVVFADSFIVGDFTFNLEQYPQYFVSFGAPTLSESGLITDFLPAAAKLFRRYSNCLVMSSRTTSF